MNKIASFQIGNELFGVDILSVIEIIKIPTITKLPQMFEIMRGLIHLRGMVIPIIDLRLCFLKQFEDTSDSRIIIMKHHDNTIGFVVDKVLEVEVINQTNIESTPAIFDIYNNDCILNILKRDNEKMILLINPFKVITEKLSELQAYQE